MLCGGRALNEQVSALEAQRRMALEREREREHWIASMLTERGQGEGGGTAGHAGLDGRGLERLDPDPMRPAATARVPGAGGDAHPDLVLQQKTPHRAQRSARPVAVGDGAGACVDTSAGGGGGRADKVGGGAADPPGVPAGDLDPLSLFGATMESWRVNELTPDKERAREVVQCLPSCSCAPARARVPLHVLAHPCTCWLHALVDRAPNTRSTSETGSAKVPGAERWRGTRRARRGGKNGKWRC